MPLVRRDGIAPGAHGYRPTRNIIDCQLQLAAIDPEDPFVIGARPTVACNVGLCLSEGPNVKPQFDGEIIGAKGPSRTGRDFDILVGAIKTKRLPNSPLANPTPF